MSTPLAEGWPLTKSEARLAAAALTTHPYRLPAWHAVAVKLSEWGRS